MRDVIDSRGAAADFRVRQFHKIEIGDGAQQRARSFADFLSVKEVAGILISDAQGKRLQLGGETEGGEKFGDVASLCREGARLFVLGFFRRKEVVVFLEGGAATGGVGDDGVEIFGMERSEIFAREIARGIAHTGVRGESAAAKLRLGDDDFAAVGGEDADGGFIELTKSDIGDASGEEGDAGAARTRGGISPAKTAEEKIIVDARKEAFALRDAEKFEDADTAGDELQARALIDTEDASEVGDAMRIGEQVAEDEIARDASEPGPLVVALDARAGVLDELAVLDARRAGGFAGPAVEAFVDVIDEGIGDGVFALGIIRELALRDVDHLVDAAAWGIGFEIPEAVGGAGVEAEAAVDAAGVVLVGRGWPGDGCGGHGLLRIDLNFWLEATEE